MHTRTAPWLLVLALAACGDSPPPGGGGRPTAPTSSVDLSTDDAVRDAFIEATGFDRRVHLEIRRPAALPGIVLVNTIEPDLGDVPQGGFVAGVFHARDAVDQPALLHLAWGAMGAEDRAALALSWVRHSEVYGSLLDEPGPQFDVLVDRPFEPPVGEPGPDGGVRVVFWSIGGWNIAGDPMYGRVRLRFAADASAELVR